MARKQRYEIVPEVRDPSQKKTATIVHRYRAVRQRETRRARFAFILVALALFATIARLADQAYARSERRPARATVAAGDVEKAEPRLKAGKSPGGSRDDLGRHRDAHPR